MEQLMTLSEFNKLPMGILRDGLISNTPSGVFMTRDENLPLLRYVVIKRIEGWTMYLGKANQDSYHVRTHGDKSNTEEYIRRCFPCEQDVYKLYVS